MKKMMMTLLATALAFGGSAAITATPVEAAKPVSGYNIDLYKSGQSGVSSYNEWTATYTLNITLDSPYQSVNGLIDSRSFTFNWVGESVVRSGSNVNYSVSYLDFGRTAAVKFTATAGSYIYTMDNAVFKAVIDGWAWQSNPIRP